MPTSDVGDDGDEGLQRALLESALVQGRGTTAVAVGAGTPPRGLAGGGGGWKCEVCTLDVASPALTCTACGATRPHKPGAKGGAEVIDLT